MKPVGLTGSGKPGRLHQEADFTAPWTALAAPTAGSWRGVGGSELFALCWEQKNLLALGHALHSFIRTNVVRSRPFSRASCRCGVMPRDRVECHGSNTNRARDFYREAKRAHVST